MKHIPNEEIGLSIYKARVLSKNKLQRKLKQYEITAEQWNIINKVYSNEGYNQKDLAKRCLKDRAALTRILDLLGKKGFIERKISPNDRREFLVCLTEKGRELYNEILPIVAENTKENFENFSDEETKQFQYLLNKFISNLK